MPSTVKSTWCTGPLLLPQHLVTLVPNPSTTSLVSISAALTGSSRTCSFRHRLSGPWLTLERRSTWYGTPSSPLTFGLSRTCFEVFREWLRSQSARLFSTFLYLLMFRMRDGLLSISLQVTTTRGSCLMQGFRSSRSRLSRNKAMWCVSEGQQAGSLWPGGVTSSSLSSGMITAATTSFRSRLHPSGLLVSSQISPCSAALRLMAPSSTLPLTMTLARSLQPLHWLRPPPRCLRRPASVASLTSRWALRWILTRARMAQHLPSACCLKMPLWQSTFSKYMRSLVTSTSSASSSSSVTVK